jgi:hypothetical protein
MMLALVSLWRLRAVARLLLARRAVARRTERAGAASGLRSEPSAKTSARGIALVCWSGWGIVGLSSRAIAFRYAERRSLGPCGSGLVGVPSARGVFKRRRVSMAGSSRRGPRSRVDSARLRTARLCSIRVVIFEPSRPSIGVARKEEGQGPRPFDRDEATGPGELTRRGPAPAPQSKPVTPASRLVAQETPLVASGLWAENSGRRGQPPTDSTPIASVVCGNPKLIAIGMKSGSSTEAMPDPPS